MFYKCIQVLSMNHKSSNRVVPKDSIGTTDAEPQECEHDSVGSHTVNLSRPSAVKKRNSNIEKALYAGGESLRDQQRRKCGSKAYTILLTTQEEDESGKLLDLRGQDCDDNGCQPSFPTQSNPLLQYFATMTCSKEVTSALDFDYLRSLIKNGVSVNIMDSFGQTVLHEAARSWGLEVAQFLIDQGADVNIADKFGRTPLHVSAATDRHNMAKFLMDQGADVEVKTTGENQTPLHYAARNEAVQCVRALLAYGAEIDACDYKQRTPLLVSAEYNSAEAAAMLLENGAFAGVKDDSGLSALVALIQKMPSVAIRALDQFHITDRTHRKQQSYLNFLENCNLNSKEMDNSSQKRTRSLSPLQAVVETDCFELVMHPIFQRLIDVKWTYFGRKAALADIMLNLLLTVVFTALAVHLPDDAKNYYTPLHKNWWRVSLEIILVLLFMNEVRKEVTDYYRSKRKIAKWTLWRTKELSRDFKYCHPRWPQEKLYLDKEMTITKERKSKYFKDMWNIVDWVAYTMLVVVFILHFTRIYCLRCNQAEIEIVACTLIVIWIRLMKYARPFPTQGPFVVILDHIMRDVFRWSFIVIMFYIPYGAAFWIMFGGRSQTVEPVQGYENIPILIFTMIRFPLVDDYNFEELRKRYPLMAQVLCGSFLILGAIIVMNMFIALMSDTFQRVYDNAKATAAMQRARLIQDVESDASKKKIAEYKEFIQSKCSPEERDYLVVITNAENQTRKQTEKISELHNIVSQRLSGKKFGKIEKCDFEVALEDISLLKYSNTELNQTLNLLAGRIEEIATSIHEHIERFDVSQSQTIAELRLSQERKFEELQHRLIKCNEECKLLQSQNTEDLKFFEASNFDELHITQAQGVEEMRLFQEENFQDLKLHQAIKTEECKLLEAQSVEEYKRFHAKEGQIRRPRKQSVKERNAPAIQTLEKIKLATAQRLEELKFTRAQKFQELKSTASQHFKELRSTSTHKFRKGWKYHSEVSNDNNLVSQVSDDGDTADHQDNDIEILWDVSLSVMENKRLRETEIERLRSGLFQGIEDLKQLQAENITDMRRIQDQEIQELKDLQWFHSEEHEETSSSGSGVGEGNITANIQSEGEVLSTLRKIYGGSATRDKKHNFGTKTAHSETSDQDE